VDCVVLDADERHRRRAVLIGERGTKFLLDLPHARVLRDGDGLVLDDAGIVRVASRPELLAELRTTAASDLVKLAWHLGNRHVQVQIGENRLWVRRDHVLEDMARGLGATVAHMAAPFEPQRGAHSHSSATLWQEPRESPSEDASNNSPRTVITEQGARTADDAMARRARPGPTAEPAQALQALDCAGLYQLLTWLSPGFPVGAFSYSGGLEWAVAAGDVVDPATLERWLGVIVGHGSGFCDAVFFVHAHRAALAKDDAALRTVAELAAVFAASKERQLELALQGGAFLAATRAAWRCQALDRLTAVWSGPYAYCVAVAVVSAGHGIAVEPALVAYLHAMIANLVFAGIRLIPLGQTAGQRVVAALQGVIAASAERALGTRLEEVGSAAFRVDLSSQQHETQHTRLFRS
jgi:urease accessory protein